MKFAHYTIDSYAFYCTPKDTFCFFMNHLFNFALLCILHILYASSLLMLGGLYFWISHVGSEDLNM